MTRVHIFLSKLFRQLAPIVDVLYRQPLVIGVFLSILSSYYLIDDYGVVNRSSLSLIWDIQQGNAHLTNTLGRLIVFIHNGLGLAPVSAGYLIMVLSHALIMGFLLAIAKYLYLSKVTRWALIFLLLCHPSYNDFRTYLIVEPIFWALWLGAIYVLLVNYRQHTFWAIGTWFVVFLIATQLTVAAWFWLMLFPFGALFWRPWRRKSVMYVLLGYALVVGILLLLPIYQGESPLNWFVRTVVNSPSSLAELLGLNESNWVKEENTLVAGIFVFSGAMSLVLIRATLVFGVVCVGLAIYGFMRKQHRIINSEHLRILLYVVMFDVFISVTLFVLVKDVGSLVSFSLSLLLFLLAALGLSYVIKKMVAGRYSRLSVLVIIWCSVAYFASGFIIFGPKQHYLRKAGLSLKASDDLALYSNSSFVLFYAGVNPKSTVSVSEIASAISGKNFYYAYARHRHSELPMLLANYQPIKVFNNRHGDELLIFKF